MLILTIGGLYSYSEYQRSFQMSHHIIESYQTIRAANQTILSVNEASAEVSALLLTSNLDTIQNLPELIVSAQINLAALNQLIQDEPSQLKFYAALKPLFENKIAFLQSVVTEYSKGNQAGAIAIASDKNRLALTHQINQLIIDIKHIEIGQLETTTMKSQVKKIRADRDLILAYTVSLLLLLITYAIIKCAWKP
jgi:CHASE3 domain sensor protein